MTAQERRVWFAQRLVMAIGLAVAVGWLVLGVYFESHRSDWIRFFLPAIQALMAGQNPYTEPELYSPPWTLVLLVPFAVLGDTGGGVAIRAASIAVLVLANRRLGGSAVTLTLLLTSFPASVVLYSGNLDALAVAGALIPVAQGGLLLTIKPQVGLPTLAVRLLRERSWRAVVILAFAGLASIVAFPTWPAQALSATDLPWNKSLWPWSIPLGLWCVYRAWKGWPGPGSIAFALVAGPLLSPYVAPASWTGCMAGLVRWPRALLGAWAFYWGSRVLALLTGGWPAGW